MKSKIMNPHKISAHSDNKQKSYGMLLIELVTWGVTNRDVLLLATIRYVNINFSKDNTKQVRIISIITRFNNNTDFCCFMQLGCVTSWPTLSFSQKFFYPSLKVIWFQKKLTKDYIKQVQNFLLKQWWPLRRDKKFLSFPWQKLSFLLFFSFVLLTYWDRSVFSIVATWKVNLPC